MGGAHGPRLHTRRRADDQHPGGGGRQVGQEGGDGGDKPSQALQSLEPLRHLTTPGIVGGSILQQSQEDCRLSNQLRWLTELTKPEHFLHHGLDVSEEAPDTRRHAGDVAGDTAPLRPRKGGGQGAAGRRRGHRGGRGGGRDGGWGDDLVCIDNWNWG